jgi:hypothetical protein
MSFCEDVGITMFPQAAALSSLHIEMADERAWTLMMTGWADISDQAKPKLAAVSDGKCF